MCSPGGRRGTVVDDISDVQLGDRTDERLGIIQHLDDEVGGSLLQDGDGDEDEDDARW